MGSTVNTMILGGLALAFSRVIDNSVISLENIYRHLEMGASPAVAAEVGGAEVNLAVLAATLVDVVDFFPVDFPLWRQQVSLFRAGPGVLPFAAGLLCGGHDGDSAVLLAVPESVLACDTEHEGMRGRADAPRPTRLAGGTGSTRGSIAVQQAAGFLRALGAAGAEAAGADGGGC